uniref:Uncharacterized protein n=1 Tax=Phlebotomus papatasi TaxID=29031 RepID=A0A1B0D2I4_PHLPP
MALSPYPAEKISSLGQDDLQEEYKRLWAIRQSLEKQVESGKQQIYELNRSLQSGNATQKYLSSELESIQSTREAELKSVKQKFAGEIEKMKNEIGNLQEDRSQLEKQVEDLRESLEKQKQDFERRIAEKEAEKSLNVSKNESFSAEAQNEALLEKITELEEQNFLLTNTRQELQQEREQLLEKVEILENRSQSRLEELQEKEVWIEELQSKLFEVNTEISALKNNPNALNSKGNSLFAEVDDQRQKMRDILAAQSKKYNQMKALYREGEAEIKRLKRENSEIAEEFKFIKNMFLNADVTFKRQLQGQIGDLRRENGELRQRLAWTEEKLNQTAKDQGVNWLDEMLKYCDDRVKKMEENLKGVLNQKIQLDESNHKMQQDLSKWRYKCLKYKCALINRELLLEESGMKFPDIQDVPVNSSVQVDIDKFEDTFERHVKVEENGAGNEKKTDFAILEDSAMDLAEKENSSEDANRIHYRDIEFPSVINQKPKNCPVDVYLDSNAQTSSRDNLPSGERKEDQPPDKTEPPQKHKTPRFTIKKIVFRK